MSSLSVLHLYRTYYPDPPGGMAEAIRQIAFATKFFDIKTKIFTLSPNPNPATLIRPEAQVFRCQSWGAPASCDLGGRAAFQQFNQLSKEADVVHYHFPWPFADLLHLTIRPSIPAVMTYHSDIVRQRWLGIAYAPLMWHMLRSMRAVIATSAHYSRTSKVLSDVSINERVQVIPLAIDESAYSTKGDETILDRIGLSENEPYFLFVGALRYYKGLHTLLEATKFLDVKVVIAGTGPEDGTLRKQASFLDIANVIFAGRISDAEKMVLLRRCLALVLPSNQRSEAYGMVLVEASLFGKPMITCEIGTGTSFVNQHEKTGFVVPPEDASALARAMNNLLINNSLALRFGNAARERYEELFSGPILGNAYNNLYRKLIS